MAGQKRSSPLFAPGKTYANVYFLKIDASGHSRIVRSNAADLADKLFDLVESAVYESVDAERRTFDCAYAEFWGWQGDGGLCVVYDPNESTAAITALGAALNILDHKLGDLRTRLAKLNIKGELHLRIAIHKGYFTYKGTQRRGSIHSKDLNFVAHLEQVAPKDSVTVSEPVFRCCPPEVTKKFRRLDFPFEQELVYFHTSDDSNAPYFEWINNVGAAETFSTNVFCHRPSELDKSLLIKRARNEILDLGTALSTSSQYLVTTRRPTYYRTEVLRLLEDGVSYVCVVLDPNSEMATIYGDLRGEDLKRKIEESLKRLEHFASEARGCKGKFKIFLYSVMPYFATVAVDRDGKGVFIFSPYMPNARGFSLSRADAMHLLLTYDQSADLYGQLQASVERYYLGDEKTKQIL
jgi:class 3 adenylate cyclase